MARGKRPSPVGKKAEEVKTVAEEIKTETVVTPVEEKPVEAKVEVKAEPKVKKVAVIEEIEEIVAPKTETVEGEVEIQFSNKSIKATDLKNQAVEEWASVTGNDKKDCKKVNVYVNVDESTAYYVINDMDLGQFDI